MTTKEKIARIQTVVAEMNSIPVFLDGTLKKNRKKIKHKDGSPVNSTRFKVREAARIERGSEFQRNMLMQL